MPCSLEKRFNNTVSGGAMAVVEYAKDYGREKAMTHFRVKDDVAWEKFIENAPNGGKGCGYVPRIETPASPPLVKVTREYIDAEIKNRLGELEIEILRLQAELKQKNQLIELYRRQSDLKVGQDILKVECI